ncbi:MAG: glycosyltransferase [Saprospiraceae bacterium]|nr:glycosyltransferase [Saprospiraceae bacterium]
MSQLLRTVCYIICYREASKERNEALQFVLRHLRKNFPSIEILIVEQDDAPKLQLNDELNIRHLFIHNTDLFNRSWAFNCAVKNTSKEIFVFADADIILEKEGFMKCLEATTHFEAITPNKIEITNVSIGSDSDTMHVLNKRKLYSFAGGMLFITKSGFEKIGGWDERFEGWGGEDNAMSHLIYNQLTSKTFRLESFHIDHPNEFVRGNKQPKYKLNRAIYEEVITRNGPSLARYIDQLKKSDLGNPEKYKSKSTKDYSPSLHFVLAITTFNRLAYLKTCIESFFQTKNDAFSWQLIIADDNSTDGTKEYLATLEEKHNAIIIHNDRTHIHHQVNSILKVLSNLDFDLCFKCDDDVHFIENGWDKLYWNTIHRTGFDHLVFFDKNWQPHSNLSRPIQFGNLVSNCLAEKIQGAFYTLTKDVINTVGYFDEQQFGASGLGHIDYSFRCCRAGFNVLSNPFDVEDSNRYIRLQTFSSYSSATSAKNKSTTNSKEIIAIKKQLLKMDRIHVAYNENFQQNQVEKQSKLVLKTSKGLSHTKFKKADATFYPERGIGGFFGFLLKRVYNLSIDLKLFFIPHSFRALGKVLNKISIHLINIEQ